MRFAALVLAILGDVVGVLAAVASLGRAGASKTLSTAAAGVGLAKPARGDASGGSPPTQAALIVGAVVVNRRPKLTASALRSAGIVGLLGTLGFAFAALLIVPSAASTREAISAPRVIASPRVAYSPDAQEAANDASSGAAEGYGIAGGPITPPDPREVSNDASSGSAEGYGNNQNVTDLSPSAPSRTQITPTFAASSTGSRVGAASGPVSAGVGSLVVPGSVTGGTVVGQDVFLDPGTMSAPLSAPIIGSVTGGTVVGQDVFVDPGLDAPSAYTDDDGGDDDP